MTIPSDISMFGTYKTTDIKITYFRHQIIGFRKTVPLEDVEMK